MAAQKLLLYKAAVAVAEAEVAEVDRVVVLAQAPVKGMGRGEVVGRVDRPG